MSQQNRIVRLFSIIGQLSPHSQITVQDLAVEYETSPRTIQRDIDALRDAKLGVFYDEDNTVKMTRIGYKKIKSWMLSE